MPWGLVGSSGLVLTGGRARRHGVQVGADGPRALPPQGDPGRVAAEGPDVVPHPAQRQRLIPEARIARGARVGAGVQEACNSQRPGSQKNPESGNGN